MANTSDCRFLSADGKNCSWDGNVSIFAYWEIIRRTERVRYYIAHIVVVLGVFSNFIAFVVLGCTRRMRRSVLGVLLMTLAIVDSIVLTFELVTLMVNTPLEDQWRAPPFLCIFANFFRLTGSAVSHLLVVCISVNRFMAVVFPLRSRWFSRARNAIIQVIAVTVICSAANVYTVSSQSKNATVCFVMKNETPYLVGITVFNMILCSVVTSVLVLVLSCWTAMVFMRNGRNVELRRNAEPVWTSTRAEKQATILLLSVGFSFVLLRLPGLVLWAPLVLDEYKFIVLSETTRHNLTQGFVYSYLICLLNYATNLYLYCLCSRLFRNKIVDVFLCITCRKPLEGTRTEMLNRGASDRCYALYLRADLLKNEANGKKFKFISSLDKASSLSSDKLGEFVKLKRVGNTMKFESPRKSSQQF